MELFQGLTEGFLLTIDLGLWLPCVDFRVGGLFDLKYMFGLDGHSIHFKRGLMFFESDQ